jgi:hypothetical protein
LQFPYATAAADIFKKEDIQTLAQAVDQHDHSTGKGLALAPASGSINGSALVDGTVTSAKITDGTITGTDIAAGTITSSNILDRTIVAADIAANTITGAEILDGSITYNDLAPGAATQTGSLQSTTANSTTSTTPVIIPGWSVAVSTIGGGAADFVRLYFAITLYTDAATNAFLYVRVDAGTWTTVALLTTTAAGVNTPVSGTYMFSSLAGGSHTFDLGWSCSASTLRQSSSVATILTATELRR